jgi:hypothetical protein
MHITTHYTLTPAEALRGTRAFKRLGYLVSVGAGSVLILLGLASALASPAQRGPALFMTLNGLLFVLLPEAVLRWARLRRGAQAYTPMEVELDDEGLTLRTETTEGGRSWASFAGIQRRSGFWIFRIGPSQAVLIPERVIEAAAATELEAFLRERKLLKG